MLLRSETIGAIKIIAVEIRDQISDFYTLVKLCWNFKAYSGALWASKSQQWTTGETLSSL